MPNLKCTTVEDYNLYQNIFKRYQWDAVNKQDQIINEINDLVSLMKGKNSTEYFDSIIEKTKDLQKILPSARRNALDNILKMTAEDALEQINQYAKAAFFMEPFYKIRDEQREFDESITAKDFHSFSKAFDGNEIRDEFRETAMTDENINDFIFKLEKQRIGIDNNPETVKATMEAYSSFQNSYIGCKNIPFEEKEAFHKKANSYDINDSASSARIKALEKQMLILNKLKQIQSNLQNTTVNNAFEVKKTIDKNIKYCLMDEHAMINPNNIIVSDDLMRRIELIEQLSKYIKRIDGLENYGSGFTLFSSSQSYNREANHQLAVKLCNELINTNKPIQEIFERENINTERDRIFENNERSRLSNHGINSTELNEIIDSALNGVEELSNRHGPQ